jgi:TRAP-type C4-dicarboxylate transport system permease small subunit
MIPTLFGYALIATSAMLLASHWHAWQEASGLPESQHVRRAFLRLQVQRRTVASALIGVIGAAITLVDRVPVNPMAMTTYLFGLLLGGVVILLIALADSRATRRHRDREHLDLVINELRKATDAKRESRT